MIPLFICGASQSLNLDLAVTVGAKTLALQTDNYYRIQFTALNFEPGGDLKPCGDLENMPAKVEYVRILRQNDTPRLIAIDSTSRTPRASFPTWSAVYNRPFII